MTQEQCKQLPIIVSLEGNIGAGKSTLLEQLEQRMNNTNMIETDLEKGPEKENTHGQKWGKWLFLKEPVHIWNTIKSADGETLLSKFYADPAKYAFAFQIMAFTTRFSELRRMLRDIPADCPGIICERSLDADKHIFAKMLHADGLIEDVLYDVYSRYFAEYVSVSSNEISLKGVVYMDADPATCFDRIKQRSRDGEGGIALDYLEKCRDYHEAWLSEASLSEASLSEASLSEASLSEASLSKGPSVLHLKTNMVATFDPLDPNDAGNQWLVQITDFLENLRKTT